MLETSILTVPNGMEDSVDFADCCHLKGWKVEGHRLSQCFPGPLESIRLASMNSMN